MKFLIYFSFILVLFALGISCKKKEYIPLNSGQLTDYTEAHKYYPMINGRQWFYEITSKDSTDAITDSYALRAVFSKDSNCSNYYRNSVLYYITYWTNSSNIMGCCVDQVLIDYDQLNQNSDSLIISNRVSGGVTVKTYQYKGFSYPLMADNYKTIKCVLTKDFSLFSNGSKRTIIRYYGYNIGLIYELQIFYTVSGRISSTKETKLVSHIF